MVIYLTSPLSYFDPGTGLTKGFKIAELGTSNFSLDGTLVPDVLTLGLTDADLSSNGFIMNQLYFYAGDGYPPVFSATITYNNYNISTSILFDTGTDPYSYFEDQNAKSEYNTTARQYARYHCTLVREFNYEFTTTPTENLTYIENPKFYNRSNVSIFSMEFFLNNEYLMLDLCESSGRG